MRNTLKGLAKKLFLGATLATSSLYISNENQAYAQPPPYSATHFGRSMQRNGCILGDRNLILLGSMIEDIAYFAEGAPSQRNQPNQRPTALFYVYNSFSDSNGNNWGDLITELNGKDRESFWEDEPILFGVRSHLLKGKTVHYELLGPDGGKPSSGSKVIGSNNSFLGLANFNNGLPNTMRKHGSGIYSAKFYIDNQHIGTRRFVLKSNVQIGVCNYWQDLNRNNLVEGSKELIGLDKKVFNEDERITLLIFARNKERQRQDFKVFNPKGEEIISKSFTIGLSRSWRTVVGDVKDLVSVHGPGTYAAAFYVNGKNEGAIPFELRGTKRNNDSSSDKYFELPGASDELKQKPKSHEEFSWD